MKLGQIVLSTISTIATTALLINFVIDESEASKQRNTWTSKDRGDIVQGIMKGAPESSARYPELARKYCECAADRLMHSMTRRRYMEISKKSEAEAAEIMMPLIQDCLTEFKREIDSINLNQSETDNH